MGIDAETFKQKAATSSDADLTTWVRDNYLKGKSQAELDAFNEERENWRPEPGSHGESFFNKTRESVAPNRPEIKTWFDLLDLDEKRPVEHAHA